MAFSFYKSRDFLPRWVIIRIMHYEFHFLSGTSLTHSQVQYTLIMGHYFIWHHASLHTQTIFPDSTQTSNRWCSHLVNMRVCIYHTHVSCFIWHIPLLSSCWLTQWHAHTSNETAQEVTYHLSPCATHYKIMRFCMYAKYSSYKKWIVWTVNFMGVCWRRKSHIH